MNQETIPIAGYLSATDGEQSRRLLKGTPKGSTCRLAALRTCWMHCYT
jgi:hypothetical protein